MAVMITGGTGFLGSYLTHHLVREKGIAGKDLILFERYPNTERIADVLDDVVLIQGDITEPSELMAVIKKYEVDQVYHLAAILGDPAPTQVVSYMRVMCDGTLNVFEASRIMGIKRVVYASSVAVYGRASFRGKIPGDELDEDDPPSPGSFYGMCKLYSENLAALYSRRFGLETVGLRPTSVFGLGRGARGSWASGLLPPQGVHYMVLPELAALGKPVEMPPDDTESDWIYAADAAEAWYCAMQTPKPGRLVYNLAAERRQMAERHGASAQIVTRGPDWGLREPRPDHSQYELSEPEERARFRAPLQHGNGIDRLPQYRSKGRRSPSGRRLVPPR